VKFTLDQAWDEASVAHFYRCGTLLAFWQSIKPAACRHAVEIGGKDTFPARRAALRNEMKSNPQALSIQQNLF
jgi:hypothetical protein